MILALAAFLALHVGEPVVPAARPRIVLPGLPATIEMSHDGCRLAVATRTHDLWVIDIEKKEVDLRVSNSGSDVVSIAWSSDDVLLSTLGKDGDLRVRNSQTGWVLASLTSVPTSAERWPRLRAHAFVAGDGRIAVGSGGKPGELWDWKAAMLVASLANAKPASESFAVSRSGERVAIGDASGDVRVWNTITAEPLGEPLVVPVDTEWTGFLALDFAPDDSKLAVGCGDAVVRLFTLGSAGLLRELGEPVPPGWEGSVGCVRWSADGKRVLSTTFPWWTTSLWNAANGERITTFESGGGNPSPIGAWFSRDGDRVVIGPARRVFSSADFSRVLSEDRQYGSCGYRSDGEHAWAVTGGMLRVLRVRDGTTVLECGTATR